MIKVLLTGSGGFIGGYFLKKYTTKYFIQTFSFLKDDFSALHLKGMDVIVHLSALVHQMTGVSAQAYEDINVAQTLALARKAKKSGVEHFIFMSTVAVYDETLNVLFEGSQCAPTSPYGKSKLEAEKQLLTLADDSFKISIVRPPMVYGFDAPGNIKSLISLINKIPILPFGNINNKRSFVYVGNLCALVDSTIRTGKEGIFLASDDRALSTTELIELIASSMPKKIYLLAIPVFQTLLRWLKPSLHKRLYGSLEVDNTHTKKVLGFTNPYSVEEGLTFMLHRES